MYALLMSVINFGGMISSFNGGFLSDELGKFIIFNWENF